MSSSQHLLTTNTTDEVIVYDEEEITNFKQSKRMSPVRYSELLQEKALRCAFVSDESRLNESAHRVITRIYMIINENILGVHKDATPLDLVRNAISLSKCQEDTKSTTTSNKSHGDTKGRQKDL